MYTNPDQPGKSRKADRGTRRRPERSGGSSGRRCQPAHCPAPTGHSGIQGPRPRGPRGGDGHRNGRIARGDERNFRSPHVAPEAYRCADSATGRREINRAGIETERGKRNRTASRGTRALCQLPQPRPVGIIHMIIRELLGLEEDVPVEDLIRLFFARLHALYGGRQPPPKPLR